MLCKSALLTLFDAHHQQLSAEVQKLSTSLAAVEEKKHRSLTQLEANQKHLEEVVVGIAL